MSDYSSIKKLFEKFCLYDIMTAAPILDLYKNKDEYVLSFGTKIGCVKRDDNINQILKDNIDLIMSEGGKSVLKVLYSETFSYKLINSQTSIFRSVFFDKNKYDVGLFGTFVLIDYLDYLAYLHDLGCGETISIRKQQFDSLLNVVKRPHKWTNQDERLLSTIKRIATTYPKKISGERSLRILVDTIIKNNDIADKTIVAILYHKVLSNQIVKDQFKKLLEARTSPDLYFSLRNEINRFRAKAIYPKVEYIYQNMLDSTSFNCQNEDNKAVFPISEEVKRYLDRVAERVEKSAVSLKVYDAEDSFFQGARIVGGMRKNIRK